MRKTALVSQEKDINSYFLYPYGLAALYHSFFIILSAGIFKVPMYFLSAKFQLISKMNHIVIDKEIAYSLKEDALSIKCPSDYHFLETPMRYKLPLKIDITAKVDSTNLRIGFGKAQLIFNWEFDLDYLCFSDPYNSNMKIENTNTTSCNGRLTENVYHDISWIMDKDFMAVLVDGEVRLYKSGFPYQQLLKDSEKCIKDNIRIGSGFFSEVTIKSLAVSELAI